MPDEPELQPNETGPYVTYLKQLLNYWDSSAGLDETNDTLDEAAMAVVVNFQQANGLQQTGYCDRATWDTLVSIAQGGGQTGNGSDQSGEALAEPVWMDIVDDIQMSGTGATRWWAGNPQQRARTDAQKIKTLILRPDGSQMASSEFAYPTAAETIGPEEYGIIEDDAMVNLTAGQGYTLRVIVNPDTQVESSRDFTFDVDEQHQWTRA